MVKSNEVISNMVNADPVIRLRHVLKDGSKVIVPASVFDPMTAKMAESLDFEIMQLAGSVASNVILDADNGFGNALNVQRCVQELQSAGVAGLTIEDSDLPGKYGSDEKAVPGSAGAFSLTSIEEHVGKLQAATSARNHLPSSICIFARTSAYQVGGIGELVSRLTEYSSIPGVDGLHIIGSPQQDEWHAIRTAAKNLPIIVSGKQNVSDDELTTFNVRLRLGPHKPWLCAAHAAYESLRIQKNKTDEKEPSQIDGDVFRQLVGVEETNSAQLDFLKVAKPCEGVKGKPKITNTSML